MTPKFSRNIGKEPYNEGAFLIRALNESADCTIKIRPQDPFRPTWTIYHQDDIQTNQVANQLARHVEDLTEEHVEQLTVESLVVLMSTMLPIIRKAPIVNMAIKWIEKKSLDAPVLNALLQSIVVKDITFDQVAVIRLAIHTYMNNSDLREVFSCYVNKNGYVNLKKRTDKHFNGMYDEADKLRYQEILAQVQTKYENPFFRNKKWLNREKPEKEPRICSSYEVKLHQQKMKDPKVKAEFDSIKNREEGKPKQLGFRHPDMHKSSFAKNFGKGVEPFSPDSDDEMQKKKLFTYNNDNYKTKRYNNQRSPGFGIVTAIGFPSFESTDEKPAPNAIPVYVRNITPKKEKPYEYVNKDKPFGQNMFHVVRNDDKKRMKTKDNSAEVTIDECRTIKPPSTNAWDSSFSTMSSSNNPRFNEIQTKQSRHVKLRARPSTPSAIHRPFTSPPPPKPVDQLSSHLSSLMH